MCPESIDAIQGALGTVCEAIDRVMDEQNPMKRAFVAIRPPGHHCGEDTPSGFCFVNNVAVAAAHAFLKHKVGRVVIFDIDLHHGNFSLLVPSLFLNIQIRQRNTINRVVDQ